MGYILYFVIRPFALRQSNVGFYGKEKHDKSAVNAGGLEVLPGHCILKDRSHFLAEF